MCPKVSIIMPVYNAEKFLSQALDSIFAQTFTDFELITIDDGSQDKSFQILRSYHDSRLVTVQNEINRGVVYSRNKGIKMARSPLIAFLDADDIALPKRLEIQVGFFQRDPSLVLLSSDCLVINENGEHITTWNYPSEDKQIRWHMIYFDCFVHPASMVRKYVFKENSIQYREEFRQAASDYDLFSRLIHFGKVKVLSIPLIKYRLSDQQISRRLNHTQQLNSDRITWEAITKLGVDLTLEEASLLRSWYHRPPSNLEEPSHKDLFTKYVTIFHKFCQVEKPNLLDIWQLKYFIVNKFFWSYFHRPHGENHSLLSALWRFAPLPTFYLIALSNGARLKNLIKRERKR